MNTFQTVAQAAQPGSGLSHPVTPPPISERAERAMDCQFRSSLIDAFKTTTLNEIETLMFAALVTERARLELFLAGKVRRVEIGTQLKIGPYRADLGIRFKDSAKDHGDLLIEVDGHEFHERTKEQAEHDRSRDRYMTERGIRFARFTGREVWRDPMRCAIQCFSIIGADKPVDPA